MIFNLKKKGQAAIYITYMFAAITIVVIAAVFAPMGVLFNAEAYKAGELILLQANDSMQSINDPEVKAAVLDIVTEAKSSAVNNIEVNAALFQYGWVLVIVLTGLIIFLYTRRMVELGAGGFI